MDELRNLHFADDIDYRSMVMRAPIGVCILEGTNNTVILANPAFLALAGRSVEEFVGKPFPCTEDHLPMWIEKICLLLHSDGGMSLKENECVIYNEKEKRSRFIDIVVEPNQKNNRLLILTIDVTDKVEARQLLEESASELRSFVEQATNATAVFKGPEFVLELVNESMLQAWDRDKSIIGKKLLEFLPELADQPFPEHLRRVYATGHIHGQQDALVIIKRKGRLENVYMDYTYKAMKNSRDEIVGILVSAVDVTDKVRAKKQLEESENNLRNIILQSPVAMAILSGPNLNVKIVNDRMNEIWGTKTEEILNRPIFDMIPETREQGFEEMLFSVFETGESVSAQGLPLTIRRAGKLETIYVNFVYSAFREADGLISGVMVVASEVTQQVEASKRIERSEASFRLLADSMPQFIWTADPDGNLNYFNKAIHEFSGLSTGDLYKHGWLQVVHREEREESFQRWRRSIETGENFIVHHRFKNFKGEYRWQLSRAIPQKDENGRIQLWVGTSTDIHDHKLFEEELQVRVRQRTEELEKKNSELEQFAHVSSHDLQEPLRKIMMFTSLIKSADFNNLSEASRKRFEKIEQSARRMSNSLKDLLNFTSLNKEEQFSQVDLNDIFKSVLSDLEHVIEQKQALIQLSNLPGIRAIEVQIHQLFYNLLNNALKFSFEGKPPEITVSWQYILDPGAEGLPADKPEKKFLEIKIRDNGIGFPQEYAEKIFTIFQRLNDKERFSGTGIGLALCKKVVSNHGGQITAVSSPGNGAEFIVLLPAD